MKNQISLQAMGIIFVLTFVLISSLFAQNRTTQRTETTVARSVNEAVNYSPN